MTALTQAFYLTPELMMQCTTRHPMFLEVNSFHSSPFGRALKVDYPGAFRVAHANQKKLGAQLAGHADGAKAMYKEMLTLVTVMGDDMRAADAQAVPAAQDRSAGRRPEREHRRGVFSLGERRHRGRVARRALGFFEKPNGVWAPTSKEAAQRFLNLLTGVSYFRRVWLFGDAKPRIGDCPDKAIYDFVDAELGDAQLHLDGLLLPAWLLRLALEQKWVATDDAHVRAYVVVLLMSWRIWIAARIVVAAGGEKAVVGAAMRLTWN